MSLLERPASFAYAALLFGCACLAANEAREMLFWIVVSELPVPRFIKIDFIPTILSIVGFLIAAIACLSMRKVFTFIAIASAISFLPSAVYFSRQGINADTWKYRPSVAGVYVFALVLETAAIWLSIVRTKQLSCYQKAAALEAKNEDDTRT